MILIADSGSTKTDWALLTGQEIQYFKTEGLNPRQKSLQDLVSVMQKTISPSQASSLKKVLFYGAGCSGLAGQQLINEAITQVFPSTTAEISTDLHGAAIGLFGEKRGITAILGTGSNCGYWDGNKLSVKPTSLGYLLGDEGSGYHIGKLLAEFYLKGNMPEVLAHKFEERFAFTHEKLITMLYQQAKPNVFLAGLTHFAAENRGEDFIKALLDESFSLFFRDYITKLPHTAESQIKITGSIAAAFEADIKNVAWKFGCQVCAVNQSPIQGIAEYFKSLSK